MIDIVFILKSTKIIVYLLRKILIALLDIENINIFTKYSNFAKIFLSDSVAEPLKDIDINNYIINLVDNK